MFFTCCIVIKLHALGYGWCKWQNNAGVDDVNERRIEASMTYLKDKLRYQYCAWKN
jgi:hypothetical protein